jgi:sulfur relay (sulfurtransferase) DsrF/TusC family protein
MSTVAILTLSGCGGSSDDSTTTDMQTAPIESSSTDIQVIDGYVVGATVIALNDSACSSTTQANGEATLQCSIEGFKTVGGKIDVNQNGIADTTEPTAPNMVAPAGYSVATPFTTLIATGKVTAEQIALTLGIGTEEIMSDPYASNNIELAKAYNLVATALLVDGADLMADKIKEASLTQDQQPSAIDIDQLTTMVKDLLAVNVDEQYVSAYSLYVDSIASLTATSSTQLDQTIAELRDSLEIEKALDNSNTPAQEITGTLLPAL